MSRRWFVANVTVGAANEAKDAGGGRPLIEPKVDVESEIGGVKGGFPASGPKLHLLGPGDVLGFERTQVVREEPAAGTLDAVAENLACVEFADASLPWLFSRPPVTKKQPPWLVLLVLREDEGELVEGDPLPVVSVPAAALPAPGDIWAWAHAEARVEDGVDPKDVVTADVRGGSQAVISRLICPRRLELGKGWLACVVPATKAGVSAGFGSAKVGDDPYAVPWDGSETKVSLPVYHSWTFRTGEHGSFEALARLVEPISSKQLAKDTGFGSRTIDVRHPWPSAKDDPLKAFPAQVTTSLQGALRIPGAIVDAETWSEDKARSVFVPKLTDALNRPGKRFKNVGAKVDRDEKAVAPPLYGSHFTGQRVVPKNGWPQQLNEEVRHRLAASVGGRYVQLEQEFLMARAWEQLGAIREANRLLAAAELANETAGLAQAKHLEPMDPTNVTLLADPMRRRVEVGKEGMLADALAGSAVPKGVASTAFRRLTRRGGGLDRRVGRVRATIEAATLTATVPPSSLLSRCMEAETPFLPDPVASVTAEASGPVSLPGGDPALLPQAHMLVKTMAAVFGEETAKGVPSPGELRRQRAKLLGIELAPVAAPIATLRLDPESVAASVRSGIRPFGLQLTRVVEAIKGPDLKVRDPAEQRPLRPIMEHPRFGMPIAGELLKNWPEWALPGIRSFPSNRVTLVETNPAFVEALMVGLNQEFNRELLWREFPTDQRGTAFARFWPSDVDIADVDEIARWPLTGDLGSHDETGGQGLLVLLVRAEVLRRFPGTTVLAAKRTKEGLLPDEGKGEWKLPAFLLAVDEQTALFGFELSEEKAKTDGWLFVLREPMRGTQFGFDTRNLDLKTWADLDWDDVPEDRDFVVPRKLRGKPPTPDELPPSDPGVWGADAADVARIAFNRPFQLAVSGAEMLAGAK